MSIYATKVTIMAETVFACDVIAATAGEARDLCYAQFWDEAAKLSAGLATMAEDERRLAARMVALIEDTYSKARAYGCEAHARKR